MTRHRTTHALLVVIAVLLGLNLTLRLSPPEAAGQEFDILADAQPAHPHVIQVSPSGGGGCAVYRLWSDGAIEWATFNSVFPGCVLGTDGSPWAVIPEEPVPLPPGIRVVEIFADCRNQIIRVLSDGTVQRNTRITGGFIWDCWQDVPEP